MRRRSGAVRMGGHSVSNGSAPARRWRRDAPLVMVAALAVFATFACGGPAVVGDPPTAGPGTSDGGGETSARADAEPADEFTVGGVWRDDSDYGVRSWAGVDPATEPQTGEPESVEAADAGAPVDTAPGSNRANAGKVGGDASATEGQPPRPTTPPVPAPSPPEAPDPTPPGEAIPRPVRSWPPRSAA